MRYILHSPESILHALVRSNIDVEGLLYMQKLKIKKSKIDG